jgi:hypothetical protein
MLQRRRVAIESNQPRRAALDQRACVPPEADGAIDEEASALRLEQFGDFVQEDGGVRPISL